jgi:hypothetical protein
MSALVCPVDGTRLVQTASTNGQGDPIHRWECPLGDWAGPWYAGIDADDVHALPELGRATQFDGKVGSSSGGVDPVSIKDGTNPARKLTIDASGQIGINNFPAAGLTDTQLRATPVPVSGTVTASGPLTDTQLRASAVPVSGTFFQSTQPVSLATNTPDVTDRAARLLGHVTVDAAPTTVVTGPLTDTQLRASAVPVSSTQLPVALAAGGGLKVEGIVGGVAQPVSLATNTPDVTDRAARLLGHVTVDSAPTTAVTGPLTDTQLRASAVPVSGTFFQATQPVSGTVTADTELPAAAALADATANPTTSIVAAANEVFNGTTWDRLKSASAANLAATSGVGVAVVAPPGQWTVVSFPATATQASAVKAAGAAGVRHVCTGLSFALSQPATALAFQGFVQILDGAAVIWKCAFSSGAGTAINGQSINITGLNLVGTAATSMTAQFGTAGGLATQQSAVLIGYDIT